MKNIIVILGLLLSFTILTQAQAPQSFSYQAVVRDVNGNVISNQSVAFRISILASSPSGTAVYSETHAATTNNFGLANLMIGGGTVNSGNFSNINWGGDDHFVQVELDAAGGTNYDTMGTTQLLSVPYALYAETSGDHVWEKVGSRAQHVSGTISVGTTPTTSAITIEGIGNSNSLIRGLKDGKSMFLVNTFNQHPFLQLYDINGNTDLIHLNTSGNSYLNGGNVGIGTRTPARKLHVTEAMRLQPSATAPTNPSAGDMYFSSVNNKLMVYDGTTWQACW